MGKRYNVNNQIKAEKINLVLSDGKINENISLSQALKIAEEEELDVVEVSNKSANGLPVCKILDYGKMVYKQNKKQKSQKLHVKEIKYNFNISDHDLETKHNQIFKFLSKHYVVKYMMELKGREENLIDSAVIKIYEHLEKFKSVASWQKPKILKRDRRTSISTVLRSI